MASALLAVALFAMARLALAHAAGLSRGRYRWSGSDVEATLTFAEPELAAAIHELDPEGRGGPSPTDLERARPAADALFGAGSVLEVTGARCPGRLARWGEVEEDGIAVDLVFSCPAGAGQGSVRLELTWLEQMPPGHRHIVHWARGDDPKSALDVVAFRGHSTLTLDVAPLPGERAPSTFVSFLRLGVEHILTGYDHLLFLFGLVLVGGRARALVGVVTAFTLAHSITLALAALGIFEPRPALIEPAIALSIVYVGVENWFVRDASRRWRITFPFGLIHGFGFAGALRQIALPRAQIPAALLAFNAGVEGGQLVVLLALLPPLFWARQRGWLGERVTKALSAGVAAMGLVWFVVRVAAVF